MRPNLAYGNILAAEDAGGTRLHFSAPDNPGLGRVVVWNIDGYSGPASRA